MLKEFVSESDRVMQMIYDKISKIQNKLHKNNLPADLIKGYNRNIKPESNNIMVSKKAQKRK